MRLWFGLFWRLGGVWALIAAIFCVGLTGISVYDYRLAARFDREAIMVPVTIERVWITRTHSNKGTKTHYHVQMDYVVGTQHLNRAESIDYAEYQRFGGLRLVQMRVLPDDPTQIETTTGETLGTAQFTQWFALGAGLLALGLGWFFGNDAALMVIARRMGRVDRVTVIEVREVKRKRKSPTHGQLVWIGPTGEAQLGLPRRLDALADWPKGSKIEVFIYKDRSFWAEDVGGRAGPVHDVPDVSRR